MNFNTEWFMAQFSVPAACVMMLFLSGCTAIRRDANYGLEGCKHFQENQVYLVKAPVILERLGYSEYYISNSKPYAPNGENELASPFYVDESISFKIIKTQQEFDINAGGWTESPLGIILDGSRAGCKIFPGSAGIEKRSASGVQYFEPDLRLITRLR